MSKRLLLLLLLVVLILGGGLVAYFVVRHGPGAPSVPAASLETFNRCGMEGVAESPAVRALNRLKNRYVAPQPAAVNPSITLAAILAPGYDGGRWRDTDGAEVVGYVWDVKPGGIETVNCEARDVADRDTHIELVLDPARSAPSQRVIVEVTPRWRAILAAQGTDWSTPALHGILLRRWVRVRGWMLFDAQHRAEAENTAPSHSGNWRATAWEIHPVISIEVLTRPE